MRALSTVLFILITLPPLREAVGAVVVTHRGSNPNVLPVHLTGTTPFDINGDGTNDLVFSANGFFSSLDTIGTNRVSAFIDLTEFYTPQVVPVSLGAEIGPGSSFAYVDPFIPSLGSLPGAWHFGDDSGSPNGFLLGYNNSGFMQYANAYIALEFMAADGIHYGWIKYVGFAVAQVPLLGPNGEILGYTLGINSPGGFVDEWGYETTPNTPIFAGTPEPGRGVLMLVAGTVTLLRRRRVS